MLIDTIPTFLPLPFRGILDFRGILWDLDRTIHQSVRVIYSIMYDLMLHKLYDDCTSYDENLIKYYYNCILGCYEFGYEYTADNLINAIENFKGGLKACKLTCSRTRGCNAFTWVRLSMHRRQCVLKKSDSHKILNRKAISGSMSAICNGIILVLISSVSI